MAAKAASDSIGVVLTPKWTKDLSGWLCLLAWLLSLTGSFAFNANVYDEAGRLKNRTLFRSIADRSETGVLAEFGWEHDAAGNVKAQHESWPGDAERTAQVRTTAMTYDGANRLETEIISDPQTGVTTTTYAYDQANNRTTKTVVGGTDEGYWSYTYNEANQLTYWSKRTASNGTLLKEVALTYDANGNRIREIWAGLDVGGGASVTNQGITYQATPGFAGNETKVRLQRGGPGQPLMAYENGEGVTVSLATAEGGQHGAMEYAGLTFTEVIPGTVTSLEIVRPGGPNHPFTIENDGTDYVVTLESSGAGGAATLYTNGLMLSSAAQDASGDEISLTIEHLPEPDYPGSAVMNGKHIVVTLPTNYEGDIMCGGWELAYLIGLAAGSELGAVVNMEFLETVSPHGQMYLSGGGAQYTVTTAGEMAGTLSHLVTITGDIPNDVLTMPPQAFSGGEPTELLSTADEVVTAVNAIAGGTVTVTATGGGSHVVSPAGPLALTGGTVEKQFNWDSQNRLAGVAMPDGKQYHYGYDYRTRRIGVDRLALGGATAQHTAVVFSGGLSLAEYESSSPQTTITSPTTTSTVRYVRGPDMGGGVGGLLYSSRSGVSKYNLSNGRGDIVAQSDAAGSLTWTASYEAYGIRPKETGTNLDKQRANSKDEDPTGLLNEGFRYRDIDTGVWLSRDPAGFVDGPNLYAYVRQNPWTAFDPHGLTGSTGYGAWVNTLSAGDRQAVINTNNKVAVVGAAVTVGVVATVYTGGAAAPVITAALGNGTAATVTTGVVSGAVGGYASNATSNLLTGRPVNENGGKAAFWGGALGGVGAYLGQQLGKAVAAYKEGFNSVKPPPAAAPTATALDDVVQAEQQVAQYGPFHRRESPTQTPQDATLIQQSGELHGLGPRQSGGGRGVPQVQAYDGPLPSNTAGIEFTTPVPPTPGTPPGQVRWVKGEQGVQRVNTERVKIPVTVTKDTQNP